MIKLKNILSETYIPTVSDVGCIIRSKITLTKIA